MSNLKLRKIISLILCGSMMNCSIAYAMEEVNK